MIVHIAGLDITVDGSQYRQRCAWCGVVLFDRDLSREMVPVDQADQSPGRWEPGALVAVDGGASWVVEPADKLPDEACAQLPHDVTGALTTAEGERCNCADRAGRWSCPVHGHCRS